MHEKRSRSLCFKELFPIITSGNVLYLLGLASFLLYYLRYETYWEYPENAVAFLNYSQFIFLTCSLVLSLERYKAPEFLIMIIVFLVLIEVGLNTRNIWTLLKIFLLVFGARGVLFDDIVKTFFLVGAMFWSITVVGSQVGLVENVSDDIGIRDVILDSTSNRECLGYRWSTNMANHLFFVVMSYFYLVKGLLNVKEMVIIPVLSLFVLYMSDARLSAISLIFIVLSSFYMRFAYKNEVHIAGIKGFIFVCIIPLFALLAYWAVLSYEIGELNWFYINTLLSGRLSITSDLMNSSGISWLGQYIKIYSSSRDDGQLYNYIDCSYMQLLIIYGVVYLIMFLIGYMVICYKAVKRNKLYLLISIVVCGFSGLIAQHFMEFYMNPFLLALFANLDKNVQSVQLKKVN